MDEDMTFNDETDLDDAVNAFMNDAPDDADLSDDDDDEETTEADEAEVEDEEPETEDDDESEADPEDDETESEEEDEEEPKAVADDEAEVVISVDGKEERVSVKDLKRLYGQEASLTQKAQAFSQQRRAVEAQGLYLAKILQDRYETAQKNVNKYADVDLFRASRELDPDEFDALRAAKEGAESELKALEREGQEFLKRSQETRATILREQAKESLKVITERIPDWSDAVYDEVRSYAIAQGMDKDLVNETVDPAAIVMIHKAMAFDKAQSAKAKVTKKVTKAPKKVVKKAETRADNTTSKLKAKMKAAQFSGDVDDVTEAFLAAMSE